MRTRAPADRRFGWRGAVRWQSSSCNVSKVHRGGNLLCGSVDLLSVIFRMLLFFNCGQALFLPWLWHMSRSAVP